ncbi:carnosine N-methyltransferase [Coccinella septempunctata]|uniref:carnosine N-methyltransferase n=1 Tax=Coccinella septempunctata TaxID=41139 RepID=UPI001D08FE60|nr:carnosine N-methyltransferase [Coccinella septempunctata]
MNNEVKTLQEENRERDYFFSVLKTFSSYREQSLLRIESKENAVQTLPKHHRKWLTKYLEDLKSFKSCIEVNSQLIPIILKEAKTIFGNIYCTDGNSHSETDVGTLAEGLDKVQSVFKQLMRDWSSMGSFEREQCYQPIIDEIEEQFPKDKFDRKMINVLVPGAGLGRLAFEISVRGFACEGNEFNMFMLVVSYFVLNLCKEVDEFEIYPWIHQYCNNLKAEDQMISVRFPDVRPMPTPGGRFSMTAGDFLEVYTDHNQWHCVATCFFIDCAPNVVQFVETIYNILKPGGVWVNLGPLLYHYSGLKNEKSIEPSFEVLCDIISSVGFEMEKCKTGIKTKYCQNPKSMLLYEYESIYFVCRKSIKINGEGDY